VVANRYHVIYQNHSISTSVGEFLLVGEKFPYGNMSDVEKILQHVRNSFLRVQVGCREQYLVTNIFLT
jgi:hypothetical protein